MSIIFQTLQKLNRSVPEGMKRQVYRKESLRVTALKGKQIRNTAIVVSLLTVFMVSGVLLYLMPGSENGALREDSSAASCSIANASPVPSNPESVMESVLLSDKKIKRQIMDPGLFVFMPPDKSRGTEKLSVYPPDKKEYQMKPPVKKKTAEPGFTVDKKEAGTAAGSVVSEQKIVRKIESAIIEGDTKNAESLLEQLADIKGEGSIYVMKLRAFFFLRTGKNRPAMSLLKKVLSDNAEDMEAGINMAILEVRQQDYKQAKTRLTRLKSIYPENTVISNLLNRLDY